MAPEYAMERLFSIKSDVYSFGILILEIVSGKKNSSFYHPERVQSLLTYVCLSCLHLELKLSFHYYCDLKLIINNRYGNYGMKAKEWNR